MDIGFIVISAVLLYVAIYLYYQNKHLIKGIIKNKEIENMKEAFLATLVHDLKTPTNAQLNTLNLLRNETFGKLNSQQQEMITLTQESCKYMSNLIGTIMDTYNHDSGEIHLDKTEFNIANLINNLCEETKVLTQNKKLEIVFKNQLSNENIYADKLQIERVIMNLLSNAITYSFSNSIIEINSISLGNSIDISITNISKQIPEQELKTIFDKYKKTKFAKFNRTSTGLGLYLSKRVIELHNGRIYAKSFPDGKCIFGFNIPINSTDEFDLSESNIITT